eukprot:4073224-Pleurochrysis_carterae.AAC.1
MHQDEVTFVFGQPIFMNIGYTNCSVPGWDGFDPSCLGCTFDERDLGFARAVGRLWTSFAASGDPNARGASGAWAWEDAHGHEPEVAGEVAGGIAGEMLGGVTGEVMAGGVGEKAGELAGELVGEWAGEHVEHSVSEWVGERTEGRVGTSATSSFGSTAAAAAVEWPEFGASGRN